MASRPCPHPNIYMGPHILQARVAAVLQPDAAGAPRMYNRMSREKLWRKNVSRYLQRISLRPYSDSEIWTGWELEGRTGEIDGLVLADDMTADELASYGVTEFQRIPVDYIKGDLFEHK